MAPTQRATVVVGAMDEPWRIHTPVGRDLDVAWHVRPSSALGAAAAPAAAPVSVVPPPGLETYNTPSSPTWEGEWAKSVSMLQSAPFLSAEQLREAVSILDGALVNAQRCASLGASDEADAFRQREQIREEQGRLFSQLRGLAATKTAPTLLTGATPLSRTTPPGLDMSGMAKKAVQVAVGKPNAQQEKKYGKPAGLRQQAAQTQQQPHKQSFDGSEKPGVLCSTQTLSSSLQVLSKEDPNCLFIVRRINKLGFKASRTLKQFFSAHGQVVRVLVAHSTVRQQSDQQNGQVVRRRPSSLGFVHMQNAEAVQRVLANGEEQLVKGAVIRVQKFEHKSVSQCEDDQPDETQEDMGDAFEWQRFISSGSLASCTTTASMGSSSAYSATEEYHYC